jgi:hypothetical protein
LRQVAVSPQNSSRVYAVDMGRRFMRSVDAGQTWIGPHPGFAARGGVITHIAVDPGDPLVVYAGTSDTGLWRSADGGVSFIQRTAGLPEIVDRIAVSPANSNVLYALALTSPSTSGVYRSTDAGIHWAPVAAPPDAEIYGLTPDPVNADVVYLVHDSRLSRSMNGGATWSSIEFGLPPSLGAYFSGNALVIDPVYPDTLVASSSQPDLGFLRSVDGGATWQSTQLNLGGLRTPVHSLALNPQRPGLIIGGVAWGGLHEYEVSPDLGVTLSGLGPNVAAGGTASLHVAVQNYGPPRGVGGACVADASRLPHGYPAGELRAAGAGAQLRSARDAGGNHPHHRPDPQRQCHARQRLHPCRSHRTRAGFRRRQQCRDFGRLVRTAVGSRRDAVRAVDGDRRQFDQLRGHGYQQRTACLARYAPRGGIARRRLRHVGQYHRGHLRGQRQRAHHLQVRAGNRE